MAIPREAKTGFWTAIGVFTALIVFSYVKGRVL